MVFDQTKFAPISSHAADSPSLYTYSTTDTTVQVFADGYFDDKRFQLYAEDIINAFIAGSFYIIEVVSSGSTVVTRHTLAKLSASSSTAWRDINIGAAVLSGPPGLTPDIVEYIDNAGAGTGIFGLGVAVGEKASGQFELDHDYKEGTDIQFHLHWQGVTAPSGTDKVNFELTYTIARGNGSTLPPVTVITKETDIDTQYIVSATAFDMIDGSALKVGDQFIFTLSRIAPTADTYLGDAIITTVGIHLEVDTLGSSEITTK